MILTGISFNPLFRQRVADGRAREERSPQVLARALLYGAYGKEHIQGFLASFTITQSRHAVMPGIESQVLELMAQIQNFGFIALSELL